MDYPFENNAELDGKYLGLISKDFAVISNTLKEAAYQVKKRNFSEYPVFVCTKDAQVEIGGLLIQKEELALQWDFRLSYLEELVERTIVDESKKENFIATYKDPDEFACLFVIDLDFVNFIYIPYPNEENETTTLEI
jgi:hypothetical protein